MTSFQRQIAVLGAGRMGTAIAFVMSASGHRVALQDVSDDALARAPEELRRISALRGDPPPAVELFRSATDASAGADLVIEALPERPDLKREVLSAVSRAASREALIATNTSSIPLAELSSAIEGPERFLGAHFWNPPYAVRLVEVVQGPQSSEPAVAETMRILTDAGMAPVHVRRDVPGMIGNRLQHALKREAIALVADGVCDAATVDTVVKLGFGRRLAAIGPLEQSDLVGLDLTLAIHEQLMPSLDTTAVPHPYLVEKVRRGELGVKAGRGFREWAPGEPEALQARLEQHLMSED